MRNTVDRIFLFCDLCRPLRNRQPLDSMIAAAMENYLNCQRKDALNKFCPLYKSSTLSVPQAMDLTSVSPSAASSLPQPPDVQITSAGPGERKGKKTRRGCRSGKLCKELKKRKFDQFSDSFSSKDPVPPTSSATVSEQLYRGQPNPNPNPNPILPNKKRATFCPPQTQRRSSKPTKVTTVGEKLFNKFLNGVVTDEKMKRSSDVHTQDLPSTSASSEFIEKKMGSGSVDDIFHPQVID